MRNIFFSLVTLLTISACNSNSNSIEVELGENKEIDMSALCNCDSLTLSSENLLILNLKTYTGKCFSNYPNTDQKYIEKEILKGEYHGKITYFNKQGKLLYSETYSKGESLGDLDNQPDCNCMDIVMKDENGIKKHYFKNSLYTGKCTDNFPNSNQAYLESNYKDGLLHGYTIYYMKNGKVSIMHNYENGKIIKEITPKK